MSEGGISRPQWVATALREAAETYRETARDDDVPNVTHADVDYLHDLADDLEALDVCDECGCSYRAASDDPPVCERCFRAAMGDRSVAADAERGADE